MPQDIDIQKLMDASFKASIDLEEAKTLLKEVVDLLGDMDRWSDDRWAELLGRCDDFLKESK